MTNLRDRVSAAMNEVVNRAGDDFVYEIPVCEEDGEFHELSHCVYINPFTGEPSCMIAQILVEMGFELNPEWDKKTLTADFILPELGFDALTTNAAHAAQLSQDSEKTWAEAREEYYRIINS